MPLKKHLLTLGILSFAVLVYELSLIRIFSVFMWYHFVSLGIALAMLGFAGGGLLVYWQKDKLVPQKVATYTYWSAVGIAFTLSVVYLLLFLLDRGIIDAQEIFRIFQPLNYRPIRQTQKFGWPQGITLGFIYLFISLPFLHLGAYLALLLDLFTERSFLIYGTNLIGSGLGCLLAVPLLNLVSPPRLLLLLGFLSLASAVFHFPRRPFSWLGGFTLLALFLALNLLAGDLLFDFTGGRFKLNIIKSGWNATSRVAIYEGRQKVSWQREISERYTGPLPEQLDLVINYTGFTRITRFKGKKAELDFTSHLITSLGYNLLEKPRVLILGAGGGPEVLLALAHDSPKITAVEINPLVVRYLNEDFAAFSGDLYQLPQVEVKVAEGRSYLKRNREQFDLVQASQLYSYVHPQAGAFQMSENYFYTLEAFVDYWRHLTENGVISFTHLLFPEARLRLFNLALGMLKAEGIANPQKHLFIASNRGMTTMLVKKQPFNPDEMKQLFRAVKRNGFRVDFNGLKSLTLSDDKVMPQDFDLRPPTDDRPFFNYMVKPAAFWKLTTRRQRFGYNDRAVLIIRTVFLIILGLAVLALLAPTLWLKSGSAVRQKFRPLTYFSAIGIAYMLVEIPLLKYLVFLLGQPIYSVSVTLFSLLLFGGLGSLSLGKRTGLNLFERGRVALLILSLSLPAYFWFITFMSNRLLAYPLGVRLFAGIILVLPLGFFMGMPLAAGLSRLPPRDALVPISWAVNGLGSVLGALAGAVFTLNFGFTLTLYAGMFCYIIALIAYTYRGDSGWSAT